jgi:dolichol-phosphate mannosyltransferase
MGDVEDGDRPAVSVIVPTLNEAANLPLLVPRIDAALAGVAYEILIMDDDSADDTQAVCDRLAGDYPLRLFVRRPPRDGLSGAVLQGMTMARGEVLVVMDADLQHPPERVGALLDALKEGADFALGSRYVPGGSTQEHWGIFRRINSRVATLLARPFSGSVRDPMSGFFALRRGTFQAAERLTPLGYKIGLELMCKCRVQNVREVPIHFDLRIKGQSKLTLAQQFKYLEHLSRLYDYRFPRLSPVVKFFIALTLAWACGAALCAVLAGAMAMPQAVAVSYGAAIAMTAALHLRYVRTQWEFLRTRHPWRDFWVASAVEWLACAAVVAWAQWRLASPGAMELFILGYGAALVGRYVCRKEFLLDVRGLHGEPRADEMTFNARSKKYDG